MINLYTIWLFSQPFIKFILILLIGHIATKYIVKISGKALGKTKLDKSLTRIILKTINIILHIIIILSALGSIGISTAGLLAALSAAGVAIAVALKDSLSNVAGGILLLISPRFSTGDYIEVEGDAGNVVTVDLLHTTIRTFDNKLIYIPNGVLSSSHITNYSQSTTRRVDITFSISYEDDANIAKQIINDTISNHTLILDDPSKPLVRVSGYGDSAVNIAVKCWCNTNDYWTVYYDLMENVRANFEKNGITIPYNQLEVNIKSNNK